MYKKVKVSHSSTCYLQLTYYLPPTKNSLLATHLSPLATYGLSYYSLLITDYYLTSRTTLTTFYIYFKVTIEGDMLRYAEFKSDKYSVLHGSNVERLEVVNSAQLEFVLKTKMSGPERGRSYSFRVDTCATIPALECMCMQCHAWYA